MIALENSNTSKPRHRPVILILESSECFFIPFPSSEVSVQKSWMSARNCLEQFLPIDAEEMLVTSVNHRLKNTGGFFAIQRSLLDAPLALAQAEGTWIVAISPRTLLICQFIYRQLVKQSELWLNLITEHSCDFFHIREGRVLHWYYYPRDAWATVDIQDRDKYRVYVDQRFPISTEDFPPNLAKPANIIPLDCDSILERAGRSMEQGEWKPWVDFARIGVPNQSRLRPIQTSIRILITSLVIWALATGSILCWRSTVWTTKAMDAKQEEVAIFRELFPGQKLPTEMKGRLRSELRKLQQTASELKQSPPLTSVRSRLLLIMAAIPSECILRIDSLKIQSDGSTNIDGAAKSLQDLESLVTALTDNGFDFSPPSTKAMVDGFSFRIEKVKNRGSSPSKVSEK